MSCGEAWVAPEMVEIDERNAELFRRYGTRERTDEPMYTCTVCGRPASIDESMSIQGRFLVCDGCAGKSFSRLIAEWAARL